MSNSFKLFLSLALFAALGFASSALAQGEPPFVRGQVVVAGTPDELPAGYEVIKYLPHANLSVVKAPRGSEKVVAQRLRGKGKRAGVNRLATKFATVNDPIFSYQWHFGNVQAQQAWDITTGSTNVIVAVLDTGLAVAGAPDGIGCVVSGIDIANNDNNPDDGDGHGTHVSGTIAQASNNGAGVAGLAYNACIMPVKVLSDSGSGSFADIADGIVYAANNGAKVINMSLGISARYGIRNDAFVDPALDYAFSKGVTVVCASGNDGHRKNVSYPAIYPTAIAVGATDFRNVLTRYSNKGDGLDIVAPGGDTGRDDNRDGYADGVLQATRINGTWGYYFFQGTSMACPHVAAAAALVIAANVADSPQEVYDALTGSALDLGSSGFDSDYGAGLLQAYDAVSGTTPPPCVDGDGDGFCAEDGDCDDSDSSVYPNAPEICDGVDNNCDGIVDEGCSGGGCTDADADGWCVEDGDCDDTDPNINPGRNDTKGRWGRDGVDNDCNGIIDG